MLLLFLLLLLLLLLVPVPVLLLLLLFLLLFLAGVPHDQVQVRAGFDVWPRPYPACVPLQSLVTPLPEQEWRPHPPKGGAPYACVMKAYKKAVDAGMNPFTTAVVVDAGASLPFSCSRIRECPCLTRARAGAFGYWCSTKGGYLDTADMSRLMGFDESMVDWRGARVTPQQFAGCIGNSMAVNILAELLPRLLYKAKVCTKAELAALGQQL